MTALPVDVIFRPVRPVRPVRPDQYEALGELTVAAYHSLQVMPDREFYDAQLRDVARRAAGLRCGQWKLVPMSDGRRAFGAAPSCT